MKKRLFFFKQALSSFFSRRLFSILKRRVYLQIVILSALLLFSKPASTAVEGILTIDSNGDYLHYCYQDLVCSYISTLQGQSDGLYEDYINNQPVAIYDSSNGYVDYSYVLNYYVRMAREGKSITINCITEQEDVKIAEMPAKFYRVVSHGGSLIRQEVFINAQGGEANNQDSNRQPDTAFSDHTGKEAEEEQSAEVNHSKSMTTIVSDAAATFPQAQTWAKSKNAHQRFVDIAPFYWKYGNITGIRPEVLYAQAALETGYGHFSGSVPASYNNWAGIKTAAGADHKTDDFESFATPEEGVRGHFNHMAAYVGLNHLGEPHGRYHTVTRISWAGTVRYVEDLSGKWAPDPGYHNRIVEMIEEIMGTEAVEKSIR